MARRREGRQQLGIISNGSFEDLKDKYDGQQGQEQRRGDPSVRSAAPAFQVALFHAAPAQRARLRNTDPLNLRRASRELRVPIGRHRQRRQWGGNRTLGLGSYP